MNILAQVLVGIPVGCLIYLLGLGIGRRRTIEKIRGARARANHLPVRSPCGEPLKHRRLSDSPGRPVGLG